MVSSAQNIAVRLPNFQTTVNFAGQKLYMSTVKCPDCMVTPVWFCRELHLLQEIAPFVITKTNQIILIWTPRPDMDYCQKKLTPNYFKIPMVSLYILNLVNSYLWFSVHWFHVQSSGKVAAALSCSKNQQSS